MRDTTMASQPHARSHRRCIRFGRSAIAGFTLIEIMIVVAILAVILAIAGPTWIRQRGLSQQRVCQENLQKIEGAKEVWALDFKQPPDAVPGWDDLVQPDGSGYLKSEPSCPSSGVYTIGAVSDATTCSVNEPFDHNE